MAYHRLDYALATRSLPEDHPHAIRIKLATPVRSPLRRKRSFVAKLKAKISRKDLRREMYDDDAVSIRSSEYSQEVDANTDGTRGRRSALALGDGDDQLMADAMKKHEEQKALFRAPSKHAPDSTISRGPSTHRSTVGTADAFLTVPSPSKPRICTDMASWAQFPSHTRADRCGSAGRADAMSTIDFGDPSRIHMGAVMPADDEPAPGTSLRRRLTNGSKKSKKRRGLVKSTSQGLERVGRYYSNLFATANFRGNNRRTSVSASTGVLQHPELEMLAPAPVPDSRHPIHEHLKKVDEDLGILGSAFRIPSFSKHGHHHNKAKVEQDDEPDVGPEEDDVSVLVSPPRQETPTPEPMRKMERNRSSLPFRKLSTFFLVESKSHKSKEMAGGWEDDEMPLPLEQEPPLGHGQYDGAVTDNTDADTIDTLDDIKGAESKSG